jgi:tripartite-type tricarboxylate transporter receptor subunit TctC
MFNTKPGRRLLLAGLIGLCCVGASAVQAAGFPERPIKMIVGFPPGGGADFVARYVAQKLGLALGVSIVVENKPGANGTLAAADVARLPADGYTLLLGVTASQVISPVLMKKMPYDPQRDFTPIMNVGFTPLVLVVNPKTPARSVEEFLRYVNASKQPVTYGSAGTGNITHMAAELFVQSSGVSNMLHIPYKGSNQVTVDLIGGHVGAYFDTLPSSLPFIQSGQLRALAVTSRERASAAPQIPTMQEAGTSGYEATTWFGVFGPANMPAELVARIHQALHTGLDTVEARESLAKRGVEPVLDTPAEFAAEIEADITRWRNVTRRANISLD